jgi:hypothetical protein
MPLNSRFADGFDKKIRNILIISKKPGRFLLSKIIFSKIEALFKLMQIVNFFRDSFLKNRTVSENP